MDLILSTTKKTITTPFVFKNGLSVFSLEQALWHTYNNWRESDFLLPQFEKWVKNVLELPDISKQLQKIQEQGEYSKQLFSFLSIIPYFDPLNLSTLQAHVASWEEDNQQTVLNNKAIELFNSTNNKKDRIEAISLFQQAYSLDKTNLDVMLNYAQALIEDDQTEKAFRYVKKAENICEENAGSSEAYPLGIDPLIKAKIYYLDSQIYRKLKDMEQAIKAIKKAILAERKSGNSSNEYYFELVEIQTEVRRYNDAIEALKQAPDKDFSYYKKLAYIHAASGDYPGAIKAINIAHDIGDETIESLTILAGYYRNNYDLESAKQTIEKVIDIEKKADQEKKLDQEKKSELQKVADRQKYPLAQIELAKIKKATGRLGEYQQIMDNVLKEAKLKYREENGWT